MRIRPIFAVLIPLTLFLGSCSQQTSTKVIQPGSPAYFWATARDAHAKGDFIKAADSLRQLATGSSEYRDRAEVWLMILSAGLTRGDMEWVDTLQSGLKLARDKQPQFRKAISLASADANQNALRYAETAHATLVRGVPPEVSLAFAFPALDASLIDADPGKIAKGILPSQQTELDSMRAQWQRRAVLRSIARATGSGENLEKASAALAASDCKVTADAWRVNMGREFLTLADFYSPKKLDHAGRAKVMLDEGRKAIEPLSNQAEAKEIRKQLDLLAKKLLKSTT
jgi:hypothetical protein